jgi:hypothetical protein
LISNVLALIIIGAYKVIDPKLSEALKKMTLNEAFKEGANHQISSWDWVIFIPYYVGFIYLGDPQRSQVSEVEVRQRWSARPFPQQRVTAAWGGNRTFAPDFLA